MNKKIVIISLVMVVVLLGAGFAYYKMNSGMRFDLSKDYSTIKSDSLVVYYSNGYQDLAEEHFRRINTMSHFYKDKFGFDENIEVYVLDREDFIKEFKDDSSYGMPFNLPKKYHDGDNDIIVTPATDDGVVTTAGMKYINQIPDKAQAFFDEAGYTAEEGIKKSTHLIVTHEFGHSVVEYLDLNNKGRWFNETLANFCTILYLEENEPELAKIWYGNLHIAYADGSMPKYTDLSSFETKYSSVGTDNYVWYQNQFSLTSKAIYEQMGGDFLVKAQEMLGDKEIDDWIEVIEKLTSITPVFHDKWNK